MLGFAMLLGMGGLGQGAASLPDPQVAALLRTVADAYDENRARFPFGLIEFDYEDGYANDLAAARKGDLRDVGKAPGSFAFKANDALYSRIFPAEVMADTSEWISPSRVRGRLDSCRLLTNGKSTFTERIGPVKDGKSTALGHVITAGSEDFFKFAEVPLDLGRPESLRDDLAQNIRMVLKGASGASVSDVDENPTENVGPDGEALVRIVLRLARGTRTFWVDLKRGAIPVRVHDSITGGYSIDRIHDQIQHVEGRGWLPFVVTTRLGNSRVKRLAVKRAQFERPPAQDTFRLVLEKPRTVANTGEGRSYTRRTVFDLNNLPKPNSPDSLPMISHPPARRELGLPGERSPSRFPYFTVFAVILSFIVGGIAWRRKSGKGTGGEMPR